VCVTPEPSTKRRMPLAQRGAAGALQALAADDGPVGGAARALITCEAILSSSGIDPIVKLAFIAIVITYVLW
jgi:hypothetical protein